MGILSEYKAKLAVGTAALVMSVMPLGRAPVGLIATVYAADSGNSVNLQVENPGLLPTNPFYFFKSLSRKTQRALTVSPVKKIDLELDILNQKAAEVQRLYEIMPDDSDALISALNLYQKNINNLKSFVDKLNNVDRDASFERLAVKLIGHSVNHLKLFDEMKATADVRLRGKLNNLQEGLGEIAADIISMEGTDKFKGQYLDILGGENNKNALKELRAVEIIGYFSQQLPVNSSEKQLLERFKEELILSAEAILGMSIGEETALPADLEGLSGDAWRRIKMLDEAREYVKSSALRNNLTLIRQLIMDLAEQLRAIGKPEAEKFINEDSALLDYLKEKSTPLKNSLLNSLLSRAEFNLNQARESMANGQYVYSFGQASAAMAVLENALGQSALLMNNNLNNEIKGMKEKYDKLAAVAGENELNLKSAPEFFNLLAQAEKALAKLSDGKNKKFDAVVSAVRDVKLLLSQTRWSLDDVLSRIEEKVKSKQDAQPLIQKVLSDESRQKEIKNEAIKEFKKETE